MQKPRLALLCIVTVLIAAAVTANAITWRDTKAGGLQIGIAADKIGFHGATPTIQRVGSAQAAVTATSTDGTAAAASGSLANLAAEAEKIGDDTRALVALTNELRAALVAKGLIKGAP